MAQANGAGCAQLPAPLQAPAGVIIPPVQLALVPQPVLDVGNWHVLSRPSHMPAQPALPAQAVRAGVPPVRGFPVIG